VSMFRPLGSRVRRAKSSSPLSLLCLAGLAGALVLTGCSSKKASDTSAAASGVVEFTAAGEASAAETIVAVTSETATPTETSADSSETTVPSDSDSLTTDAVTADSAQSDGATPTSVDPQAAMEAAIVTGMSSQLGVTDPKQLACVGDSVKGADFTKPEGQGKILRGVLKCAPDAMAAQGAKALRDSNPSVTEKQSVCVVKATFEVLSEMADADLVSAMSNSKLSPAIVEATLAKAKGCGLSEAEIRKAIQQ
jgi:hypothetical protein